MLLKLTGFARSLATCVVFACVATNIVAAQIIIRLPAPHGPKQPQPTQQRYAVQIVECESPGCTPGQSGSPIWHLNGTAGMGQFGTGNQQLTVEHITASAIAIRRVDASGFQALYTGVIQGNRIFGSVLYYDVRNPNLPKTGVWNGTIEGSLAALKPASSGSTPAYPFTLRECESNRCLQPGTQYPITWTFPSRDGQGWLNDKPRPMTLENLTPGFIVARRDDTAALGGLVAYYFGQVSGNQITGSVLYIDANSQQRSDTWSGQIQTSFIPMGPMFAAGQTSPQPAPGGGMASPSNSNAGPTAPHTTPPGTAQAATTAGGGLFDVLGCTKEDPPGAADNALDMFVKGKEAEMNASDVESYFEAIKWYCRASRAGSSLADFELGRQYEQGFQYPGARGPFGVHGENVLPDMNKAFAWYKKAADRKGNEADSEAKVTVARFNHFGPAIHFKSGDYSSISNVPVNLTEYQHWLNDAAALGDTEAMKELGQDIFTRQKKLGEKCSSYKGTMQEMMPDRQITDVYPGEMHNHSFFCVAILAPAKQDDSDQSALGAMLSGLNDASKGNMLNTWTFTVYFGTDPDVDGTIIRSSSNDEMMRRVTDFAIVTAFMKNASK